MADLGGDKVEQMTPGMFSQTPSDSCNTSKSSSIERGNIIFWVKASEELMCVYSEKSLLKREANVIFKICETKQCHLYE